MKPSAKIYTDDELEALREIASELMSCTGRQLDNAITGGALQEICHENLE